MKFDQIQTEEILSKANTKLISHTFTAASTLYNIAHTLRRLPRAWKVCNLSAESIVYGTADEVYLNLTASAPCSVVLEVS